MLIEIENIRYHVQSKGEGKAIICLHGFSENVSTWNALQLGGYRIICVDLIGHGKSDKPYARRYYSVEAMIRHLNKLASRLGLRKYSMLGYSMGGRIALAYALAYPRQVEKLILESASYGECGRMNRLKRCKIDAGLAQNIREKGIAWFNQYWSDLVIFASQKKLPEAICCEISERRLSNAPYALSNTLLASGQGKFPCLKNKIASLSMPVLYVSGEYDEKYQQTGNQFKRLNPNIRHETIKGVGHNTHLEDIHAFEEALTRFLS